MPREKSCSKLHVLLWVIEEFGNRTLGSASRRDSHHCDPIFAYHAEKRDSKAIGRPGGAKVIGWIGRQAQGPVFLDRAHIDVVIVLSAAVPTEHHVVPAR